MLCTMYIYVSLKINAGNRGNVQNIIGEIRGLRCVRQTKMLCITYILLLLFMFELEFLLFLRYYYYFYDTPLLCLEKSSRTWSLWCIEYD